MKGHILVPILVIACLAGPTWSDSRLPVPIKINGKPAQLSIDTGAERTCLFDTGARRLGLQVTPPDPNIKAAPGRVVDGKGGKVYVKSHPRPEGRTLTSTTGLARSSFLPTFKATIWSHMSSKAVLHTRPGFATAISCCAWAIWT